MCIRDRSSTGHLLGAAGAVEAVFSIMCLKENIIPPTLNLDNPSVKTKIDLVPHESKKKEINSILSNSFALLNTNSSDSLVPDCANTFLVNL